MKEVYISLGYQLTIKLKQMKKIFLSLYLCVLCTNMVGCMYHLLNMGEYNKHLLNSTYNLTIYVVVGVILISFGLACLTVNKLRKI